MEIKRPDWSRILLLAIVLMAFALRVHRLAAQSLWYDEAVTAQVVQQGLGELARWTADDIQPPLYYALVAGWTGVAGLSEAALRWPSVLAGTLTVALAFALGRRLFSRHAGLLAALLAALHPLWLYYSQEARMYTLLTGLGLLAGYLLLRIVGLAGASRPHTGSPRSLTGYTNQRRALWLALALVAVALLYTHYFAAFLLLAFGLFFLVALALLRPAAWRTLLAEAAVAGLVASLAYLPWLPNALRRFGEDASYWQGALKLDEALRHLAISFSTGETVQEAQATGLAWITVGLGLACLLALLWQVREGKVQGNGVSSPPLSSLPLSPFFLLLYLLVPVVAILALSYRTPKFNARYLMLASPALVLLLAGGLSQPFRRRAGSGPNARLLSGFSLLALSLLLAVYLYADRNWFADPAFTKDDWRGAVSYVQSHLAEDEGVVLVSGHALPAWRYYAPAIQPLRLPPLEILDVNAVLGLEDAAAALAEGLTGKRGAWLVQWQEEVVDPTGAVPFLLQASGQAEAVPAGFWGLGTPLHVRFAGEGFAGPPAAEHTLEANFGNQVELIGFSQPPCGQPMCPLYLFWRALAPLQVDLKLSATLQAGPETDSPTLSRPQDRRLAAYEYPTFRWPPGQVVLSRLLLEPELGTPPAEKGVVQLTVYDEAGGEPLPLLDAAGNAQGTAAWLSPVRVDGLITAGPGGPTTGSQPVAVAPEIELIEATAARAPVVAGDRVGVVTWWRAAVALDRPYRIRWQWLAADGSVVAESTVPFPVGAADSAGPGWPAGALLKVPLAIRVPAAEVASRPGPRAIRLGVVAEERAWAGETADLAMTLEAGQFNFEAPPVATAIGVALDGRMELVGADGAGQAGTPGATVAVTLTWRSLSPDLAAYAGFVHLLDGSGRLVAQDDHLLVRGGRSTANWLPGEVVQDQYEIALPPGLARGTYRLVGGLYRAGEPGLPRLRTPQGTDHVDLAEVAVN